jgi:hypothetical protein
LAPRPAPGGPGGHLTHLYPHAVEAPGIRYRQLRLLVLVGVLKMAS